MGSVSMVLMAMERAPVTKDTQPKTAQWSVQAVLTTSALVMGFAAMGTPVMESVTAMHLSLDKIVVLPQIVPILMIYLAQDTGTALEH